MSPDTATFIVQQITFLFAYIISVSVTGALTAWITDKLGDPTARDYGYLTLNPLVHINIVGMLFIVWMKIGYGNRIPIDSDNLRGPYRHFKMALAYYADAIACIVLAFVGLFILLLLFGPEVPDIIKFLFYGCANGLTHIDLAHMCPTFSSARITAIFILLAMAYLNVVLGAIQLITNSFYLYMDTRPGTMHDITQNYYMTLIAPFILVLLFGTSLVYLTVELLTGVAHFFALLLF